MQAGGPTSASRWSRRKLAVLLYPFVAATVAINLFLASLLGAAFGVPVLTPMWALVLSLPLGLPATWAAVSWVNHLLDEAEK